MRLPGAVSLSIDANGENENFYADNSVYYVINNNAGYDGDLEVALITTDFATAILGEQLDAKGVLVERNDAETSQFALMFEFDGDKNHIRHMLYCCSASRPATEGETTEESKSVKTEKLSLKAFVFILMRQNRSAFLNRWEYIIEMCSLMQFISLNMMRIIIRIFCCSLRLHIGKSIPMHS